MSSQHGCSSLRMSAEGNYRKTRPDSEMISCFACLAERLPYGANGEQPCSHLWCPQSVVALTYLDRLGHQKRKKRWKRIFSPLTKANHGSLSEPSSCRDHPHQPRCRSSRLCRKMETSLAKSAFLTWLIVDSCPQTWCSGCLSIPQRSWYEGLALSACNSLSVASVAFHRIWGRHHLDLAPRRRS